MMKNIHIKDKTLNILYSLSIMNSTHFDLLEDWFSDNLRKKDLELLEQLGDYCYSPAIVFFKLFQEDKLEYICHDDCIDFYNEVNNIDELFKRFKITPAKMKNLQVIIDFNLENQTDVLCNDVETINNYFNNYQKIEEPDFNIDM